MKVIRYRDGYKYQLDEPYQCTIDLRPDRNIITRYVSLTCEGLIVIAAGYAWDGASGPTVDTKSAMRGSLVHDSLYQLIRLGHLPAGRRFDADQVAYKIWREDGMLPVRARLWRWCLNRFAHYAIDGKDTVLTAP